MKRLMIFSGILAAVALGLAAWLVLDQPKPNPEQEWRPTPLIPKDAAIDELTMVYEGKTIKFVYQEQYDSYAILADGKDYIPDKISVDRFINAVLLLKRKKLIALDPPDLTIYALKPPALTLTVKFDGEPEPLELEIGKENYTHDAIFAKIKGKPTVFLIPMDIGAFIGLEPKAFRTRSLFYSLPMDVASIEIKIDDPGLKANLPEALDPKLVVQKSVEGEAPNWMIVSPISERAVFQKVNSFFNQIQITNAVDILDPKPEELAGLGLAPPRATVTLTMFTGRQEKISFGRQENGTVYATNSARPEVLVIPISSMVNILLFSGRLESPISERREIVPAQVLVEYPREGLPTMQLDLLPDRHSFAIAGAAGKVVLLSRVRRIMKLLRENKAVFIRHQEPYNREQYGLSRPRMHFRVLEGDTVPVDVAFGNTATINDTLITYVEDLRRKCVIGIMGDVMSQIPYGEREFTTVPKARQEQ